MPQPVSTASGSDRALLNPQSKNLFGFASRFVLYFMRERTAGNDDIKYLIATNTNEWFIFSASDFNDSFYKVPKFRKDYEDWKDGKKVSSNTDHFYNDIAKPYIEGIDKTLECTYFDLREYAEERTSVRPDSSSAEKKLIALYKLLSPYFLLKQKFADDSSTLDKKFYTELLHIIGLEEHKEKSKTLIRRKVDKSDGSLIEKAISKLETEYFVYEQGMWKTYGDTKDEQISNAALELCIVWVNRILFLKLLEGQLAGYHDGEAAYRFLDTKTVNNFNELYTLFHDVLNCTVQNRKADIGAKYSRAPYLNSSLFDFADVERDTIRISSLDENLRLSVNGTSILKKLGETAASLPTLEYLLRFLDAYDFASEGKEDIQKENRPLINASVLGKVFEKINGYKDGSIYTPGFITMYMCRQTIRLAVVQKFKDGTEFDGADFSELKNWIGDRNHQKDNVRRFNEIIDSLKLCDPAVGSGHFLVSALNEILVVKSELKILADEDGDRFGEYAIEIANDELVITDHENNLFECKCSRSASIHDRTRSGISRTSTCLLINILLGNLDSKIPK